MSGCIRTSLFSLFVVLAACQPASRLPEYEISGPIMGTTFSVKVVAPPDTVEMDALDRELQASLLATEELASTWLAGSELSQFNNDRSTDWIRVSDELCAAVSSALALSQQTGGAFDITVGPLVNLWGFGPTDIRDAPPTEAEIDALRGMVGFEKLQADCSRPALRKQHGELYVDLSGWAKGFAVDQLATILAETGIDDFLAEVGGELRAHGLNAERKDWSIAIEKPLSNSREVQSILRLSNSALATSGDYRNFFEYDGKRFSHTIDPRTGRPVTHALASVTVLHESAATADGLATALLVLGPEEGLALAEELGINARFQVRTKQGFEVLSVPAD